MLDASYNLRFQNQALDCTATEVNGKLVLHVDCECFVFGRVKQL
jgi:hypothetical protein